MNLLAEVVAGLEVEDDAQTVILDGISEVFAHANRVRAVLERRRKSLRGAESRAEFGAQFKLFGQAVAGAQPVFFEACDGSCLGCCFTGGARRSVWRLRRVLG